MENRDTLGFKTGSSALVIMQNFASGMFRASWFKITEARSTKHEARKRHKITALFKWTILIHWTVNKLTDMQYACKPALTPSGLEYRIMLIEAGRKFRTLAILINPGIKKHFVGQTSFTAGIPSGLIFRRSVWNSHFHGERLMKAKIVWQAAG